MKYHKIGKLEYVTHEELTKELFKDPEFKKAYAEPDVEFQIIDALIEARKEKKISQREFAKRVGIAQSALARFESKKSNPTLSSLMKIINGLGLKLTVSV